MGKGLHFNIFPFTLIFQGRSKAFLSIYLIGKCQGKIIPAHVPIYFSNMNKWNNIKY